MALLGLLADGGHHGRRELAGDDVAERGGAVLMAIDCGFHRFMDAVFGTDWRRSLSATRKRGIRRQYDDGRFARRTWHEIRRMVRR